MSLKQIAEMAGVSISTASRVLNNKDYRCASDEIKQKIWTAAQEINYVPNESARKLQKGESGAKPDSRMEIAVVLARTESLEADPFFNELYQSIEQEIFSQGCIITSFGTAEALLKNGFPTADGFLILGRSSAKFLTQLKKKNRNIVAVDRNPTVFEIDEVICDGKKAAQEAMQYLIEKGHRNIGYIGECSYENRYVGYCDSLIKNGIPMNYSYIRQTDQSEPGGYAAMKLLLQQTELEAVFCANDMTAIGALRAYGELPKNTRRIDIISIDNIKKAEEVHPLLTTMNVPENDMGKMAVKILLDRIHKGHTENIRVEFPSRLVKRESR